MQFEEYLALLAQSENYALVVRTLYDIDTNYMPTSVEWLVAIGHAASVWSGFSYEEFVEKWNDSHIPFVDSNYEIPEWALEAHRKYLDETPTFDRLVDIALMAVPGLAGFFPSLTLIASRGVKNDREAVVSALSVLSATAFALGQPVAGICLYLASTVSDLVYFASSPPPIPNAITIFRPLRLPFKLPFHRVLLHVPSQMPVKQVKIDYWWLSILESRNN